MFVELAGDVVDTLFAFWGVVASYTPPGGGAATDCTVIVNKVDPDQQPGDGRPLSGTVTIAVRKSEIASPAAGGTFAIGAVAYAVKSRPAVDDPEGLVWTMWAR